MATTTNKPTLTNDQPPTIPGDDLDYLRAEQRRINDAIKAARAALPKLTPLQRVEQQQAEHP